MIVIGILYLIYFSGQTIEFIRLLFNPSKYRAEHSVANEVITDDEGNNEDFYGELPDLDANKGAENEGDEETIEDETDNPFFFKNFCCTNTLPC